MISAALMTRRLLWLCLIVFAISYATPAYAAPRPDDASDAAIKIVRKAINRAAGEVSTVIDQSVADDALAAEDDSERQRFSFGNAEIWLPASFTGGDLEQDLDMIIERLRNMGPDFAFMADALEQNPGTIRLFAVDTEHVVASGLTNVTIGAERVFSFVDSEVYLDAVSSQLPAQYAIRERQRIELPGFEDASRAILDADLPGAPPLVQVMYVVKDNANTMWVITFSTQAQEFDAWLPVFERSIKSFAVTGE